MNRHLTFYGILFAFGVSGCQLDSRQQVLATNESQVQLRSIESRAFDTADKEKMLRSIISTLQDLNFVVDKADNTLGTVSATKLSGYMVRITVTIRPRGEKQLLVRANAQYNEQAVDDPKTYQNFFAALEKSLFLTAQNVD
jgi:hypothetical protein